MGTIQPTELEKYKFIRKLGQGGFGEVWLANDLNRGEKVAVKFLHLDHSTPGDIAVFKREFEILSELKQIHLARVFDFGYSYEKEQYFLSTEYCPGKKLFEAIAGKPVSYFEEIFVQLLTALECIHSQGIIHFDIKPENILVQEVDDHPKVKLVDFGVAVRIQMPPEQLGGTLVYVAPEVIERSTKLDHRVDLYSLGMLSVYCLTKKWPFNPEIPQNVTDWHRRGGLSAPDWEDCEAPAYLREIIEKLLEKNPSNRFSNARVILNFLNLATGGRYRQAEEELPAQIPLEGPLVERRDEVLRPMQENILEVFSSKTSSRGGALQYISGERGIGKSRILEEIRHFVQVSEIPFLRLDCDWNIPTWPKLEKWLGIPPLESDELNQKWQTRRRMDAILESAKGRPFCLLIDDFHKADQELKDLVNGFVEFGQGAPLFILLTSEEEVDGSIALKRLTQPGVFKYLQLVLGEGDTLENLADVLFQYSGGLPVLMVEGLRFIAPHFFRGEKLENLLQPAKVHLLFEDKINKLKKEEVELLYTAALIFRPVSQTELNTILQVESDELIKRANPSFKLGLLSGNLFGEAIFRVSSQALALDLVASLNAETRTRLHGNIAQGLSQLPYIPFQELAYHLAKAGEKTEAIKYYSKAAEGWEKEGKILSACDCLKRAAAIMEAGSGVWARVTLKIFRLLVVSGKFQEAASYYEILKHHPSWEREETEGWLHFKLRQFPESKARYRQALAMLPEDQSVNRILIKNALGNIELQEGKYENAVRIFQETFRWEKEIFSEDRLKINNNNLGLALSVLGQHDAAIQFFTDKLQGSEPILATEKLALLNGMGFACLKASRYEETISTLKKAMSLAEESGALHALFSVMGNLITALLKETRYVEALTILKKIDLYQRRFGTRKDIAHNLLRQTSVYLMLGMGEFALECIQEGWKISHEISETLLAGWFSLMKAYWERDYGVPENAEEFFRQSEEDALSVKNEELQAWAQYGLADHFFEQGNLDKCRACLEGTTFSSQDNEFEIRMRLLSAKSLCGENSDQIFSELEGICRQNHYKELLWEIYYAWGMCCFARKARVESLALMEKGIKVMEEICTALPEEYRFRYLNQRWRKKVFADREKIQTSLTGGVLNRIKRFFPLGPKIQSHR